MATEVITLPVTALQLGQSSLLSTSAESPCHNAGLGADSHVHDLVGCEKESDSESQRLVKRCMGETVKVPNLMSLMPAWPKRIHSQEILDWVNVEIDKWLPTVNVAEAKKTKHRAKSNYAILASVFYSDCAKEKLIPLTKYQYWIFWFDDEIDTGGELSADATGTRRICDRTLQCVQDCLHPDVTKANFVPPPNSPGTVEVLYEVLAAMRPEMGPTSIERMRRELIDYVEGVARQQAVRQDECLPDPSYHFEIRCDDVGVIPSITHTEYAMDFELPDEIRYHEAMECIVMECTRLAILVNEILSCQKEFRVGQLENMVLLLVNSEDITVNQAVSKVIGLIRKHYALCEEAVARLPWTEDEDINENIREYVRGCRRLATGTGHWAYLCTRYFEKQQLTPKWELEYTLKQ